MPSFIVPDTVEIEYSGDWSALESLTDAPEKWSFTGQNYIMSDEKGDGALAVQLMMTGPVLEKDNWVMMYFQLENPEDSTDYQSWTCGLRSNGAFFQFVLDEDTRFNSYSGSTKFEDSKGCAANASLDEFCSEEVVLPENEVWKPALFADFKFNWISSSLFTKTSTAGCFAARDLTDETNFSIKVGSDFNFYSGFRLYDSESNSEATMARDTELLMLKTEASIDPPVDGALAGLSTSLAALCAIAFLHF